MTERIVRVSGVSLTLLDEAEQRAEMDYQLWRQTRDMDSIVNVEQMPRTGDGYRFRVVGTPP